MTIQAIPSRKIVLFIALFTAFFSPVFGIDIRLIAVNYDKVQLAVNGGTPQTITVGARTSEGVRIAATNKTSATIELNGLRRELQVGEKISLEESKANTAVLSADKQGHFYTTGSINGTPIRFVVDTGATHISLGASDARRLGLDMSKGVKGMSQTANGVVPITQIRFNSVKVGNIVLSNVQGSISSAEHPALLGMSFLNRVDMQRSGNTMVLRKN